MPDPRMAALTTSAVLLLAACGSGVPRARSAAATSDAPASQTAAGCKVGVSWNNYQEERWARWDEPAIKKALAAGGATYISNDARSSAETQSTNIENLVSWGAKVLIVLAQDGAAVKPAIAAAQAHGVAVIAYDRLIEDPRVFYVTFDNKLVGKMQAQALLAVKSAGNFVVIKGNKADANADFLRAGMVEAGLPDVGQSTPTLVNVGETYTDNWDAARAQAEMERFLSANSDKIDIAFVENDEMAGGVVAALAARGLAGKVPVSGQDGDAAALNRIALGTQTVDVWKDARLLGDVAGKAALELCAGKRVSEITGSAPFRTPGGNAVSSILLEPNAITRANLNDVLSAGWIDKEALCRNVPAGTVSVCR